MRAFAAFIAVSLSVPAGLVADDTLAWPRFRGPNGSGVAEGQKPPIEFCPNKNVKWKVPAPSGISSPIVAGDLLVITAFEPAAAPSGEPTADDKTAAGKLYTVAYRRREGQEVWRAEAPAKKIETFHKAEGSPAASTPATDGKHIVSYFGSCGLFCYDLAGKELWRYELPTAVTAADFGTGVSPIIAGDAVILVRDEIPGARILALDVATGSKKWEHKRNSPASWCTPVIWDSPAGPQVAAAGHARLVGYDLKTGVEQWFALGVPSGCCSSPVVADGKLYFAGSSSGGAEEKPAMPAFDTLLKDLDKDADGAISRAEGEKAFQGFFDNQDANKDGRITREEFERVVKFFSEGKNSAFALKPGGSGDVTDSHKIWQRTKGLPYVASAILYRGQFVMVKDGGIVIACDAETGAPAYQGRLAAPGRYYASPVAADGRIYLIGLESGAITVLRAGSDKGVVWAQNPELGERCSATPAIADDALYVRTATHLYAFAEEK